MSQMNLENLASLVTIRPASPLKSSRHEPSEQDESFGHQLEQAHQAAAPSSTDERSESPPNKADQHDPSEETAEQPTSPETETEPETIPTQPTKEESEQEPFHDEDDPGNRIESFIDFSQSQQRSDEPDTTETIEPVSESVVESSYETDDENTPLAEPDLDELESLVIEESEPPAFESTPTVVSDEKVDTLVPSTENHVREDSASEPPDVTNNAVESHRPLEAKIDLEPSPLDEDIPTLEPSMGATENLDTSSLLPENDFQVSDDKESLPHDPTGVKPIEQDRAQPTSEPMSSELVSSEPVSGVPVSSEPVAKTRLPEPRPTAEPERIHTEPEVATPIEQPIDPTRPIELSPDVAHNTLDTSNVAVPVDPIRPNASTDPLNEKHATETRPIGPTGVESNVAIGPPSSSEGSSSRTTLDSSARGLDKTPATDQGRFIHRVTRAFQAVGNRSGKIRMQLHPPELGSLRLELTVRNGMMHAQLETETSAARNLLLDNLPALRQRLAEQEIKVEQFNVDVSDRQTGGSHQSPGNQSRSSNQGDSRNPGNESQSVESVESEPERTGQRNDPASFDVSV